MILSFFQAFFDITRSIRSNIGKTNAAKKTESTLNTDRFCRLFSLIVLAFFGKIIHCYQNGVDF